MIDKNSMRQSLGTYEHLSEKIDFALEFDFAESFKLHTENIENSIEKFGYIDFYELIHNYAMMTVPEISRAYTRGDSLKDIEAQLFLPAIPRILTAVDQIDELDLQGKQYFWGSYVDKDIKYKARMNKQHVLNSLVLVSHCLSFNVEQSFLDKVSPKIAPPGGSIIVDLVLSTVDKNRTVQNNEHYKPDPLEDALITIYQAPQAEKPKLIIGYLNKWLKLISARREGNMLTLGHFITYTHKTSNTLPKDAEGKYPLYMGHWAWEILCLVKLQDIDDASFRDHEWYPVEMADYKG